MARLSAFAIPPKQERARPAAKIKEVLVGMYVTPKDQSDN
jgi:hypothetical protein